MAASTPKLKLPTNPEITGPGTWLCIHVMAMSCEDEDSCLFYIQFVKAIIMSFTCKTCKEHALKFIERNPLEKYIHITNDIGEHIGMFKHSWEFHNFANYGLGKPRISFQDAWELYSSSDICVGDCTSEETDINLSNNRLINGLNAVNGSHNHIEDEDSKVTFSHSSSNNFS